jgi:uncharacterized protein (DUF2249 family)
LRLVAMRRLDLRDLEPPEPFVAILTALGEMAPGERLEARLPRRPVPLLPVLAEQGISYELEPAEDGSWVLRLTKS